MRRKTKKGNQRIVKIKPSKFAESVFTLDGVPFNLKNRNYLLPIYDADIGEGIIMSGRQVEKSTTNATKMATDTLLRPNFKGLYVAPISSQVGEFAKERIGKFYNLSQDDVVNRLYRTYKDANAVMTKEFSRVNSVNYFKHCYDNGDNIRGITVNGVWIDEVQDIHIDAIPVIKECQSHALEAGSKTRMTWYTGTPKTFNNTIQQYWDKSTKHEWTIKCPHCGNYQILGEKNMTPTAFLCRKCRKVLTKEDIANGFWYKTDPEKDIEGFRISQMMVPWITAEEIWKKYEMYPTAQFFNEVLGRSYEDSAKPFTSVNLGRILNNDLSLLSMVRDDIIGCPTFMGIDWGTGRKSYTVVTVFALLPNGHRRLVYSKIFKVGEELTSEYQVRTVCGLMEMFNIAICIPDWGFGAVQNQQLRDIFGDRIMPCYYSFSARAERKWDPNKEFWVVNRTSVIFNYVDAVNKQKIVWPGRSRGELDWLIDHHLAENSEYTSSLRGRSEEMMYTHSESKPDDGLHSCVYANLAADIYQSETLQEPRFGSFYM